MAEFVYENLGKFTAEQLREHLLKEGHSPEEVDEAIAVGVSARKPKPAPFLTGKLVAIVAVSTLGMAAIAYWALTSLNLKTAAPEAVTAELPPETAEERAERIKREALESFTPRGTNHPGVYMHALGKGMVTVPEGFDTTPPLRNPDIRYHFAFKHAEKPFEVRVQFAKDKDRPNPAWGRTLQKKMNGLARAKFTALLPDVAKRDFGADWGYVSEAFGLDPRRKFNGQHRLGLVLLLHRNRVGTYTVFFLTDTHDTLKAVQTPEVLHSVRFQTGA